MADRKKPQDVLSSTTPEIKKIAEEVLKIEREYQNFQNLSDLKEKEKEVCDRIVKLIEKEVKE